MYNRAFFRSKLGEAAFASIGAMVAFVALSTQMTASHTHAALIAYDSAVIEIA